MQGLEGRQPYPPLRSQIHASWDEEEFSDIQVRGHALGFLPGDPQLGARGVIITNAPIDLVSELGTFSNIELH
jgi:hypothetical protein